MSTDGRSQNWQQEIQKIHLLIEKEANSFIKNEVKYGWKGKENKGGTK